MPDETTSGADEMLSADLDGEATAEERARIEADPALRERRERLRAAARATGTPPPPLDRSVVDELIAGALPAAGHATARTSRRGPHPVLVAAAVVALVAIGLGLVFTDRPDSNEVTSRDESAEERPASGDARSENQGPAADGSLGDPSAADSSAGAAAPATAVDPAAGNDLGDFPDAATLRTAVRDRVPPGPGPTSGGRPVVAFSSAQVERCRGAIEARNPGLRPAERRATATATIAGQPVLVVEYATTSVRTGAPTTRVVAVGIGACEDRLNVER